MSNAENDKANELRAKVTSLQAMTAKDGQEGHDYAHFVRLANDEVRRLTGLTK